MTERKREQGKKEWKGIRRSKDGEGYVERIGVTCRARLAVSEARPQRRDSGKSRGCELEREKRLTERERERDSEGGREGWKETQRWARVRGD